MEAGTRTSKMGGTLQERPVLNHTDSSILVAGPHLSFVDKQSSKEQRRLKYLLAREKPKAKGSAPIGVLPRVSWRRGQGHDLLSGNGSRKKQQRLAWQRLFC
jgi:hypothetical protein